MKATLIYNPNAGLLHTVTADAILNGLMDAGYEPLYRPTSCVDDLPAVLDEAEGLIVVAGGDGTVNEAVNGLVGTGTALAVLPVGTGNLWAKQLRVPTYTIANPVRFREAAEGIVKGAFHQVDVGRVDDRYFLGWAGIGLDAQVTSELEPRPRHTKRLGALPYAIAAVMVASEFTGVRTRVSVDGKMVRGRTLLVLVNNIRQYGGLLHIVQEARMDDGLLDVFVFKGLGFSYALRHLMRMLSRRYLQDPKIVHLQGERIEVSTDEVMPVEADGDPVGTTPVTLTVVPGALRIVVPPTAPDELFANPVGERVGV